MILKCRLTRILSKVPNTPQYWQSHRTKLKAQIEEYGPPTFFATFSPAEYDWDELYTYLRERNSDLPNLDTLTPTELIAKDPTLSSHYIHQKFNALLDFILSADPLGKVISYFIRHEYQGRGVVHFHTFLWIKDAPVINKSADDEVVKFISKYITCRRPNANDEPTLQGLVDKYQTHKCRAYCKRVLKSGGKWRTVCRFGFPRPKTSKFLLHDVLSSIIGRKSNNLKKRLYDLPRNETERYINDYNPELLLLWQGNMDIQFLSEDTHSIAHYVTKYITKPDKSHLQDILVEDNGKSLFQKSLKFAYASLRSRELGAHEAADRILQNNGELWRSSEKYEFVQTTFPKHRSRTLKSIKDLENQEGSSRNIYYGDMVHDFYPKRPQNLEHMSLYSFVEKYEKIYIIPKSASMANYIIIKDSTGRKIATMKERNSKPVIYHHEYNINQQSELFYYSMLSLHKPWRSEQDILGDSSTYKEEFLKVVDNIEALKKHFESKEVLRKAKENMEQQVSDAVEQQQNNPPTSQPPQNDSTDIYNDDDIVRQGLQDYETINNANDTIQTEADLAHYVATMNPDQHRIYTHITKSINHILEHEENSCSIPNCSGAKPLRLYVSGFGGTGKSYLIRGLVGYFYVQRHVHKRKCDTILDAPTGQAAANINGQTIHSVFNIPVQHGNIPKYSALSSVALDQMRAVFQNLKCMILDEVSMVSNILLLYMHLRLCDVFGTDSLFGNRSVILFGDLLQLPPVNAQPPFVEISGNLMHKITGGMKVSLNIWREFEYDELNISQRQTGDKNHAWRAILGRIRYGELTEKDIKVLKSRLIPMVNDENPSSPTENSYLDQIVSYYLKLLEKENSAICLLPKRIMVDDFNRAVLAKRHNHSIHIECQDEIDCKNIRVKKHAENAILNMDRLDDPRNTAGLEKVLTVAKGARIMLRKNLDVKEGLVNGSVGVLHDFILDKDGMIEKLAVLFDGKNSPTLITRDKRKIRIFNSAYLFRKQFPISLAYGLTIHKSQGLSLKCVLTDLGKTVFSDGQSYVALSRVVSLDGLHLINFSPQKVKASRAAIVEYSRLKGGSVLPTKNTIQHRQSDDRVWYTTASKTMIKNVIKNDIDQSSQPIITTLPSSRSINNNTTKRTRPIIDTFQDVSPSVCIQKILTLISKCDNPVILGIRDSLDLHTVYTDIINQNLHKSSRNEHFCRIAKELNPDPLVIMRETDKWLSSTTICEYGDLICQTAYTRDNTMVYNIGPYVRKLYLDNLKPIAGRGRSVNAISKADEKSFRNHDIPLPQDAYVHHALKLKLACSLPRRQRDVRYEDFMVNTLHREGDPLSHDIIVLFGNDDDKHWYAIIIDNRVQTKKTLYFDSADFNKQQMIARCKDAFSIINDLRDYLRAVLKKVLTIPNNKISLKTHPIEDGKSRKQKNHFDCGPYSLINCELYVNKQDHRAVIEESLPLIRASLLSRLYFHKKQYVSN